jgi:hypothetical protein
MSRALTGPGERCRLLVRPLWLTVSDDNGVPGRTQLEQSTDVPKIVRQQADSPSKPWSIEFCKSPIHRFDSDRCLFDERRPAELRARRGVSYSGRDPRVGIPVQGASTDPMNSYRALTTMVGWYSPLGCPGSCAASRFPTLNTRSCRTRLGVLNAVLMPAATFLQTS